MDEIEINGQLYRVGKMPALTQFHVSRRLAPVLAAMGFSAEKFAGASIEDALGPIAQVVAKMPEDDVNYIIFAALDVVQRKQGERYSPVRAGNGRMLFEDIDMPTMLRLTVEAVKVSLGGFFALLPGANSSAES